MIEVSGALRGALESRPTLATGQADDLKIDTGTTRVWISRADGAVSVEVYRPGPGLWINSDNEAGDLRAGLLVALGDDWEAGIW